MVISLVDFGLGGVEILADVAEGVDHHGGAGAAAADRDFIGKAALLANPPARKLVGLVLLDRGVLRSHQAVHTAHGPGEITSGTFSPTLEKSIALARVPKDVQIGDRIQVEVRDKMLAAQVVKYPFARNGKVVVSL